MLIKTLFFVIPAHSDVHLNIVPLVREFQPDADELDDRYLFVGPSIGPRR